MHKRFHSSVVTILVTVILFGHFVQSQQSWNNSFSIQENSIGVLVGFIYTSLPDAARPPYTFYSAGQKAFIEKYFTINLESGEIRTKVKLDREENETYTFALLKNQFDYIQVTIRVTDVNDNAPRFVNDTKYLEIPENAPHYKIPLGSAVDLDIGANTIQSFTIISGNVDFAFNVSGRFSGSQILLLDLGINGTLDYEITKSYTLIIRVYDGGTPRLYGDLTVYITIVDVNDNQPIFNQSKYSAAVQENATIGKSIIEVFATDLDSGDNGRVSYYIDRQNSDPEEYFLIDMGTGIVTLQKRLDYELKTSYKLIVIARDHGAQPLQTSVLIDIEVLNINEQPAKIEITFLTNQTGRIREDANPNDFVARISVSDPDASSDSNSNITVRLEGGEGYFGLIIRDRVVYLIVIQTLDRETKPWFNLTIVAVDSGTPPLFQSKSILLTVDDVNDNRPVFSSTIYLAEIEEMSPNGSSVVQVTATDRDIGENARITYSISDDTDSHSDWFQIDINSGLITTHGKIDCEVESKSQLIVMARDSGIPQLSSSATVVVSVLDINDKEPMFEHSQYSAAVPESRTVGSCILQVNATDPDCGVNGHIHYFISNDTDYPDTFSLDPTSGKLCIKKPLDYEKVQIYDFPVIAVDVGNFDTTAHVQITVTDVNDNSPIFYPLNYSTNEEVSTPPGSEIITVKATDLDSGAFGTVTYNISSGNSEGRFRINETTGVISLVTSLPSVGKLYTLQVVAKDGGGLMSTQPAEVQISVPPQGSNPPVFERSLYRIHIAEDIAPQASIGVVKATTSAPTTGIEYSITAGDKLSFFRIDPQTGELFTSKALDHDEYPSLLLNILAQTRGSTPLYGTTQVNITIDDVNDNPPIFSRAYVVTSVSESIDSSTVIYVARATDKDSRANGNGEVRYKLRDNPGNRFNIDTTSGEIRLAQGMKLDYETVTKYEITIIAYDQGQLISLSSSMTLEISVQDANDNTPVFSQNLFEVSVPENMSLNTKFKQISATDRDSGENGRITFSLLSAPDSSKFGIFPSDGYLYLKEELDREVKDHYVLTILCQDHGSPSRTATATVSITVTDINDNDPVFTQISYTFSIEENLPVNRSVGYISATDADIGPNAELVYNILSGNPFVIKQNKILTTASLDREEKSEYDFNVVVSDRGDPPRQATVSVVILVTDTNDNKPVFLNSRFSESVDENKPKGTRVVQIIAQDVDYGENATITFSLQDGGDETALGYFSINSKTGWITTKEVLDYETKNVFNISIVAADGGNPPNIVTHPFEIRVRDDNDEAPVFSTYNITFYIEENVQIGTVVGMVKAYDKDAGENGRVSYYIVAGNIFGLFAVDHITGQITTIREVDYEESSSHSVAIKAVDNSVSNPKSNTISVSIHIVDLNDNAPVFDYDPLFLKVRENSGIGQIVYIFTATDADSGRNGTVSYQIQNLSAAGYFALDQTNGQLKVSQVIDYETVHDISLVVKAFDGAPNPQSQMATTLTVMILILDENDNAPIFQNIGTLEVSEDEAIGFLVASLIAVDIDSNVNNSGNNAVSYTMQSGNDKGMFSLNTKTGQLTIAKQLDRESVPRYSLVIGATDHGTPAHASTTTLTIVIMDINDNPPHFLQSIYQANVSEDTSAGSSVTTVRATDLDQGVNQELSYMIPEGIADDRFVIDPNTGVITTQAILDRESKSSYVITVYVTDKGYPVQYDTATLIVNVTDVNDHPPVFKEKRYTIEVPENLAEDVLYTFAAHDEDIGINGQFTYSITAGNSDNKFSIHPTAGNLGCTGLDRELVAEYTLTVTAVDRGNPTLSSSCIVVIRVLDQNDNDPKFSSARYSITLMENVAIGALVLTVSATDPDQGSNGNVTYALNNDTDAGLFRIDINTGVITTSGFFDREKKSSYSFDVIASDAGLYDRRTEKVRVDITIGDINDNAPVFKELPYTRNVSQFTPSGQLVLSVRADDKDDGSNGKVTYSISLDTAQKTMDFFTIESLSGSIKTAQTLGSAALGYHHLKIIARDQGNIPLSSTGVVEITVGSSSVQTLSFNMSNYQVNLNEDSSVGSIVAKVQATYQGTGNISYSFASGNQNNAFRINSVGLITVNNSDAVDYESDPTMKLIVAATVSGTYAYTTVTVNLQDINDNVPTFTQDRYVSAVWEEMPRNTFVTQVVATDADTGHNAEITYNIVQGNIDNAFIIDPPYSGIVKTNLVIDYEVQSSYKLEIEAIDNGEKVLSSTCTLKISVVNINDNPPKFPPMVPVNVSEDTGVGSVVNRVTASDVDQNPAVTYNFTEQGNPDNMFSIDLFSGQIRLAKALDHEKRKHYTLGLEASDTVHIDYTTLDIYVTDENDNAPEFSQQSYQVTLEEMTPPGRQVMRVNATDIDSGLNAQIRYKLGVTPSRGFYINSDTGVIYTNETVVYQPNQEIVQLVVIAEDRGTPSLSGVVAVHIQITSVNKYPPEFDKWEYRSNISEDAERGVTVLSVFAKDLDESGRNKDVNYEITTGNDNSVFGIQPKQGNIVLNGVLDRETVSWYNLTVVAKDRGSPPRSSSARVRIEVLDVNDQVPVFDKPEYQITLNEGYASEKVFLALTATDRDIGKNADIYYSITSGNDDGLFIVNGMTGEMLITPRAVLDYESHTYHKLIVRAMDCRPCSQSDPKLSSFTTVLINVTDVNEFSPSFPLQLYFLGIDENQTVGAPVYYMHANDGDTGPFGHVEYTIKGTTVFSINNMTGLITANLVFDYETNKLLTYNFTVMAKDAGNLHTEVPVLVNILDVDEYAPVFTEGSYQFQIAGNAKRGTVIGRVSATDKDGGEAGHVVYRLVPLHDYFQVDMNTGEIIVSLEFSSNPPKRRKRSSEDLNHGEILHRSKRAFADDSVTLTIQAYSEIENSLTANTDIKILIDRTCDGCKVMPLASPPNELGVAFIVIIVVAILAVIFIVVIVLILVRNRYLHRKSPPRTSTTGYGGDDTDFDYVPTTNGPPQYSEHLNNYNHSENMASSNMSPHSHNSGSSGHGSVEEDEDEEISRINSNSAFLNDSNGFRKAMPDSGIQDDDNASEPSVLNHHEYLARLGIDNDKINSKAKSGALTHSVESMHQFSEEGGGECDGMEIGTIDYTKLDVSTDEEVAMIDKNKDMGFHEPEPQMAGSLSSVINSEEEYSGSYNWDYLLDWGPQYQPLAHVFAEIARLKDDNHQPKKQPVQTVPQSRQINTSIQPPVRMVPPPIITNAPPITVSQPSSRSNQSSHSNSSVGTRTSTINTSLPSLPRSPISHESSFTSPALTPSFTPSLSPLATRSPSISPVNSGRGMSNSIHSSGGNIPRGPRIATNRMAFTSSSEQELQI